MDVFTSNGNIEELRKLFGKFRTIFDQSKGLIDFPALQFVEVLMELGDHLPGDESFDDLFESVLLLARERENCTVSGRMLLRRGMQKLKSKQPYEAIRLLGRAQQDLAVHESRGEMAAALAVCASAYEEAGLPWAARGSLLLATNQALKEFWEQGKMTAQALACLRGLIWIELWLARIPCALMWIETFLLLSHTAQVDEERRANLKEEWTRIDVALGALLLGTDIFDLKDLAFLPNVLERFHLDMSWMALLYALGYEDRLRAEKVIPAEENSEALFAFFKDWLTQPGLSDLPKTPEYLDRQSLELRSIVLGCEVTVNLPNNPTSLYLSEAILSGLEAFLATSLDSPLLPHTPRVKLRIVPRDFMSEPLSFNVITVPQTIIEVSHPKEGLTVGDDTFRIQDKLVELIATITGYIAILPDDGQVFLETLIKGERGFGRALLITNVEAMIRNLLGDGPKFRVSDWNSKPPYAETFPLLRQEIWDRPLRASSQDHKNFHPIPGTGEPPANLFNTEGLKHRDRKVISLINIDLWNRAGWVGTGFATSEEPGHFPYLILMFTDPKAAMQIFAGWQQELGQVDTNERLRVSIVTGIDSDNPAAYRVIISENPSWSKLKESEGKQVIIIARLNTMTPDTSNNLNRFMDAYRTKKEYLLIPGQA
jgi:hypothetical protein